MKDKVAILARTNKLNQPNDIGSIEFQIGACLQFLESKKCTDPIVLSEETMTDELLLESASQIAQTLKRNGVTKLVVLSPEIFGSNEVQIQVSSALRKQNITPISIY